MKTLVVYYSRSGNTKLIADEVAVALGADVISVQSPGALAVIGFVPRAIAQHGNRN